MTFAMLACGSKKRDDVVGWSRACQGRPGPLLYTCCKWLPDVSSNAKSLSSRGSWRGPSWPRFSSFGMCRRAFQGLGLHVESEGLAFWGGKSTDYSVWSILYLFLLRMVLYLLNCGWIHQSRSFSSVPEWRKSKFSLVQVPPSSGGL